MRPGNALAIVSRALRSRPGVTLASLGLGVALWTWLEYMVHRHVLHGRFPDGASRLRHWLHRFFDTMHGDHHLRPWDGMYINGFLDSVPFAALMASLSFLMPLLTAPVVVATLLQCYVIEEWVHYATHKLAAVWQGAAGIWPRPSSTSSRTRSMAAAT